MGHIPKKQRIKSRKSQVRTCVVLTRRPDAVHEYGAIIGCSGKRKKVK